MKFPCPNCEQNLEIGDDLVDTSFPCPSCGKSIHIEVQEETDSSVDDYTDFSCAHCDGIIRTAKSMEGSEINCPHCSEITFLNMDEDIEEEFDPYKKEETDTPIEEVVSPKKKEKRIIPNYAFGYRQIIGLVGGIILFIGVFLPVAKIPILGTVNLFMSGLGNGVFIFFFAIISLIATLFKKEGLQMIMGLLSLGILTFTLGGFLSAMSLMRKSQSDISQIASNFITIDWGWALLVVSCGMLIVPAFMKAKPTDGGEEFFVLSKPWRISAISISSIYGLVIIASIFFGVLDFAKFQFGDTATNQSTATKPEKKKGWEYSSSTSPIDDSKGHILRLEANEKTATGIFGNTPTLIIRHKEGETEVYINIGSYLGSDEISVVHRLDNNPPRTWDWGLSSDSKAIFYPSNERPFILQMLKAKRLVIRLTPFGESPITSTFNLTGLDEALNPMKPALRLGN